MINDWSQFTALFSIGFCCGFGIGFLCLMLRYGLTTFDRQIRQAANMGF